MKDLDRSRDKSASDRAAAHGDKFASHTWTTAGPERGPVPRPGNQGMQRLIRPSERAPVGQATMPVSVARALAGRGAPLPAAIREPAEAFFGADLGAVRVHSGDSASRANRDLEARAFSVGSDIVLDQSAGLSDRRLIAHELAHVLQPSASSGARTVGARGDAAEREADAVASRFAGTGSRQAHVPARLTARRSALIHCDTRHPSATVLDADYQLYEFDSTDYDNTTQHYYLSPWDRAHMQRMNGLYVLQTSSLDLIGPPEVRAATGGRGVLIPMGATDVIALAAAGRAGAAQFAIDLVRRTLGVTVPAVTLSTGANQDFTVPTLDPGVSGALASPLHGVDAVQTAGVDAARARAAAASQERTLSLAGLRGEELPMREIGWSDEMDVPTLGGLSDAGRADWYVGRLATLQTQLLESAHAHHLPMQLLAAVILNELADINALDVLQSGPSTFGGSLGIAQIQVSTARTDHLVDLPAGSHRTGWQRSGMHAHDIDHPSMVDMGERLRIGQLLQVPQIAIEAAAREVEMLLTRMAANQSQPWQVAHGFTATGPIGDAIYASVGTGDMQSREGMLADAVCGAYNSPDVITAADTTRFSNARIHGQNANDLAQDLYRFRLYRTT
jgi:hypothetical protein